MPTYAPAYEPAREKSPPARTPAAPTTKPGPRPEIESAPHRRSFSNQAALARLNAQSTSSDLFPEPYSRSALRSPHVLPRSVDEALSSSGTPLEPGIRSEMEDRYQQNFGSVRLHLDHRAARSADAVGALAYTVGEHLAFNTNAYVPHSLAGQNLLAHELAHVVQQRRGSGSLIRSAEPALERDAAQAASAAMLGHGVAPVREVSGLGLARQPKPFPDQYPKVERLHDGLMIDGVKVLQFNFAATQLINLNIRVEFHNPKSVDIDLSGTTGVEVVPYEDALLELYSRGIQTRIRLPAVPVPTYQELPIPREGRLELANQPVIRPITPPRLPVQHPKPLAKWKPHNKSEREGATRAAEQQELPQTPRTAPTEDQEIVAELNAELNAVEATVAALQSDIDKAPEDRALNEVKMWAARLQNDEKLTTDYVKSVLWLTPEAYAAIERIKALRQTMDNTVAKAEEWHTDNSMGRSLGMMNDDAGTWLAGKYESETDKGGAHVISGGAAIAGSFLVAVVDSAEKLISFGFHDAATAVAQAYANGDISWNEGKVVLEKAAFRSILTALVTRWTGGLGKGLGASAARGFGLASNSVRFGLVSGGLAAGVTGIAALGTQSLVTLGLQDDHSSVAARSIFRQGLPSGKDWAVSVSFSILLGAAVGGASAWAANRPPPVGSIVNTPRGPLKVLALTKDSAVLGPLESTIKVPPPPRSVIDLVYDPATNSWGVGNGVAVEPPVSTTSSQFPPKLLPAPAGSPLLNEPGALALPSSPAASAAISPARLKLPFIDLTFDPVTNSWGPNKGLVPQPATPSRTPWVDTGTLSASTHSTPQLGAYQGPLLLTPPAVTGPSFADVAGELESEASGTIRYSSNANAAAAARDANLTSPTRLGFQSHSTASNVRGALRVTGRQLESVHVFPQVAYRALRALGLPVSEGRALTALLPRAANAAFDNGWVPQWRAAVRAGRPITAGDTYNWLSNAINNVNPNVISSELQGQIQMRLRTEIFVELGLDPNFVIVP